MTKNPKPEHWIAKRPRTAELRKDMETAHELVRNTMDRMRDNKKGNLKIDKRNTKKTIKKT